VICFSFGSKTSAFTARRNPDRQRAENRQAQCAADQQDNAQGFAGVSPGRKTRADAFLFQSRKAKGKPLTVSAANRLIKGWCNVDQSAWQLRHPYPAQNLRLRAAGAFRDRLRTALQAVQPLQPCSNHALSGYRGQRGERNIDERYLIRVNRSAFPHQRPLVEPYVRFSRIRLSRRLSPKAHTGSCAAKTPANAADRVVAAVRRSSPLSGCEKAAGSFSTSA
jgi:hypothetical protein